MNKSLFFLFSFFWLLQISVTQQFNFSSFSIEDGLAQSQVYAIFEDSRGFIWIGTDGGGVSRFDGVHFENYNASNGLKSNPIRSIFEDNKGMMWFGTKGGYLSKFDGKRFVTYNEKNGLTCPTILSIAQQLNGNIIVGSDKQGLFVFENDRFLPYLIKASDTAQYSVTDILVNKSGAMWIATANAGIYVHDNFGLSHYTIKDSLPDNSVTTLCYDKKGNIWVGTKSGLARYDGKKFISYNNRIAVQDLEINDITCDLSNDLWIATGSAGIFRFDHKEFFNYNTQNGICNNNMLSITCDRTNTIWMGSDGGGVCKFEGEMFKHLTEQEGLIGSLVMSVYEDKQSNIWLASYGQGIGKFDGRAFTNFSKENGLCSNNIYDILEDKEGSMWFASKDDGISRWDGTSFTNFSTSDGLPSNKVYSCLQDRFGNLWFSTLGGGISIFDGTKFTNVGQNEGLGSDKIYTLFEDREKNIWFGTDDAGVAMIFNTYSSRDIIKNGKIDPNSIINLTKYGLGSKMVLSITQDTHGNIWIGTFGGGLTKYDGKVLKIYSEHNGLNSNYIYQLLVDSRGYLWAGTEKGLNRIDIRRDGVPLQIKTYGREEGFTGIETNFNAAIEDRNGFLWFGNLQGATKYNYMLDMPNEKPPVLSFTGISLFYEQQDWSHYSDSLSEWASIPRDITLSYDKNHLSFEFIGIDNKAPAKITYSWMLDGFDKSWSPKQKNTRVTYSFIPPGEYVFKVNAFNSDGISLSVPLSLNVKIMSPFWHRWWFYLGCGIVFLCITLIIIKLRVRHLEKVRVSLLEKVDQRTKELLRERKIVEDQTRELQNQKADLEKINKELEKISLAANKTDNGVTILNRDGTIVWRNEAFFRLYNDLLNEMVLKPGQNLKELGQHIVHEKFTECLNRKKTVVYTTKLPISEDESIWLQTTLTPVFNGSGDINQIIVLDTDISDVKKAEEEVNIQKEKLEKEKQKVKERNFYWFADRNNNVMIATVDCTGHGVPGAFMSMIGNNLLTNIVNEKKIYDPAKILFELDQSLVYSLNQNADSSFMDGMDISICSYNTKKATVKYAGANRPLFYVSSKDNSLKIIQGDKYPIGGYYQFEKRFTQTEIEVHPGDCIYIFSDGFSDQFGGVHGKKFMTHRLKMTLKEISTLNMEQQKSTLEFLFNNWKGNLDQVDDILMIGIRF